MSSRGHPCFAGHHYSWHRAHTHTHTIRVWPFCRDDLSELCVLNCGLKESLAWWSAFRSYDVWSGWRGRILATRYDTELPIHGGMICHHVDGESWEIGTRVRCFTFDCFQESSKGGQISNKLFLFLFSGKSQNDQHPHSKSQAVSTEKPVNFQRPALHHQRNFRSFRGSFGTVQRVRSRQNRTTQQIAVTFRSRTPNGTQYFGEGFERVLSGHSTRAVPFVNNVIFERSLAALVLIWLHPLTNRVERPGESETICNHVFFYKSFPNLWQSWQLLTEFVLIWISDCQLKTSHLFITLYLPEFSTVFKKLFCLHNFEVRNRGVVDQPWLYPY